MVTMPNSSSIDFNLATMQALPKRDNRRFILFERLRLRKSNFSTTISAGRYISLIRLNSLLISFFR